MNKANATNILFIIIISLIILFFSFSYLFSSDKTFSENENRLLQVFPTFTVEKLLNGTYTHQLHNYFSDQMIFRNLMIETKAITELLMGKNENNGILLGRDNYLIETHQYTNENYDYLSKNLSKIEKMMHDFTLNNVNSYSIIIPRKVDVLEGFFSPYYSNERNKKVWNILNNQHINPMNYQKDVYSFFYKTDHHLTAEGIYFVYKSLGDFLNYIPYPLNHFNLQVLSNSFHGTTYSKSGFFFVDTEEIQAPTLEKSTYKMTIVDTGLEFDTLYDYSYLSKKDKYGVFLSGNNAHVKIYDTKDKTKETLLLIKDSFSHALAPFLCEHYNLELIDPRYYNDSIEEYIKENEITNVLFLFGIDTLASGNIVIR